MHGKTRQPNPTCKIPNTAEKNKQNKENNGLRPIKSSKKIPDRGTKNLRRRGPADRMYSMVQEIQYQMR